MPAEKKPSPKFALDCEILKQFEKRGEGELTLIRDLVAQPDAIKQPRTWGIKEAATLVGRSVPWMREKENCKIDKRGIRNYTLEDINNLRTIAGTAFIRPPSTTAHIVTVMNFKGGVGKTTSTIHLAHRAAIRGMKVLVVDIDPQASSTFSLGGIVPDLELEADEVINDAILEDPKLLAGFIKKTYFHNVDLIPTNLHLQDLEYSLPNNDLNNRDRLGSPALRLAEGLKHIRNDYDLILLDCAPNMGSMTANAILASNAMLVPVPPSALDRASFVMLTSSLLQPFSATNKKLDYFRIIVTKHTNSRTAQEQENRLRMLYGEHVMVNSTYITTEIEKATALMSSVYDQVKPLNSRDTFKRAKSMLDTFNDEILDDLISIWEGESNDS